MRLVNDEGRKVTVPMHSEELRVPLVRRILQQAGLSDEEWDEL